MVLDALQQRYAGVTAAGLGILIIFYYLSKKQRREHSGDIDCAGSENKDHEVDERLNIYEKIACEAEISPVTSHPYAKSDQGRGASGEINERACNASRETTNIKLDVHVAGLNTQTDLHSVLIGAASVATDEKYYEHIDYDGNVERIAIKTKITKKTDKRKSANNEGLESTSDNTEPGVAVSSHESSIFLSEPASWVAIPDSSETKQLSAFDNHTEQSFDDFNSVPIGDIDVKNPDISHGRSPNSSLIEDNSGIEDTDDPLKEEAIAPSFEQTDAQLYLKKTEEQTGETTNSPMLVERDQAIGEDSSYKTTFTWKSSSPAPDHSKEKSPSPSEVIVKDHMITVVSSDNQILPEHPEDVVGLTDEEIKDALLTSQSSPDCLSSDHAKVLVRLLSHPSIPLQQSALGNISRCAVFTPNQNILRENGCLPKLGQLLRQQSMALHRGYKSAESRVTAISTAITNLAVNKENHKELGDCVPKLVDLSLEEETGESICLTSLLALTNLSVTPQHHGHYTRLVQRLYELLDSEKSGVKMQALKILVNLSCNVDMVPHLLAAKAPDCLLELLSQHTDEGMVLRWTTLLANTLHLVREKKMTQSSLPKDDKAPSPETMFSALYSINRTGQLKNKVFLLSKHPNKEIQDYAAKIYNDISSGH